MEKLYEYEHNYYCSESNYYSSDASEEYENIDEFFAEWKDADIDYNLIFRFDVKYDEENKNTYAQVFYMLQRKGIFKPVEIKNFDITRQDEFIEFLKPYWKYLKEIWQPISDIKEE